ncbi:MAG: L-lysine 6-transaminase [Candidatus Marinimicrobia bacterium]|nr:L-lysine 6-transaminase [Candidatus Neomarinimicrobiota bacterium]
MTKTIAPGKVRTVLGKHLLTDGFEVVIDLDKSHGSWLVDAVTGREYLDLFAMFASMTVGYNHPTLLANRERLGAAAVNKPTLSDIYSQEFAAFVDTFSQVGIPDYLPHTFFIEGGGLAVENALKAAFDWKVRRNLAAGKGEKGSRIIHFAGCFHGRTGYTMSMTDSPDPRKTLYFPKFDWPRISHPRLRFPSTDDVLADVEKAEKKAIDQIKQACRDYPDDIAALIIEPIQGEGGDNHIRPEFARQLRQVCDQEEIILIYDEIQTGVGITGAFWAHEHFGDDARPDIITFGKKSQVCGMLAGPRLDEVDNNVFHESSRINSTFGGNLIDMMRFDLVLQIVRDEKLVAAAHTQGRYLMEKLEQLAVEFPGFVTEVRGQGLFAAFDLPSDVERDGVLAALYDNGAIVLGCGERSVRFRPHLTISRDEIDLAYDLLVKSVRSCLS